MENSLPLYNNTQAMRMTFDMIVMCEAYDHHKRSPISQQVTQKRAFVKSCQKPIFTCCDFKVHPYFLNSFWILRLFMICLKVVAPLFKQMCIWCKERYEYSCCSMSRPGIIVLPLIEMKLWDASCELWAPSVSVRDNEATGDIITTHHQYPVCISLHYRQVWG